MFSVGASELRLNQAAHYLSIGRPEQSGGFVLALARTCRLLHPLRVGAKVCHSLSISGSGSDDKCRPREPAKQLSCAAANFSRAAAAEATGEARRRRPPVCGRRLTHKCVSSGLIFEQLQPVLVVAVAQVRADR